MRMTLPWNEKWEHVLASVEVGDGAGFGMGEDIGFPLTPRCYTLGVIAFWNIGAEPRETPQMGFLIGLLAGAELPPSDPLPI